MREINANSFWDNTVTSSNSDDGAYDAGRAIDEAEVRPERDIYLEILGDVAEYYSGNHTT